MVTSPGGPVALTFDDNRFNNRWSYHGGGNNVHVTGGTLLIPLLHHLYIPSLYSQTHEDTVRNKVLYVQNVSAKIPSAILPLL